jgi:D-arabinose 1-dehydrogenase-like Zn-dependent alcohol dehydrogenase
MASRFVQVSNPKGDLEVVEREIPEPGNNQVRLKIQACGVCHSDSIVKEGLFPGIQYPRVPGHEVAGVIDIVGKDVIEWKAGQRVGVGWHGGQCGKCESCRRGDFFACRTEQVTGMTYDGGYADYMIAPTAALALIPDNLSATEAAPLMCAGITTYNALRNSGARVGDLVAILGVGGVGHLGIQFASKMGLNTIAIARGKDKEVMAKKLGANHYIDSQSQNASEELVKLVVPKSYLQLDKWKNNECSFRRSRYKREAIVIGAANEPLEMPLLPLLLKRQSIMGWNSGSSIDSQDTLSFSELSGVRSMNEIFPLERAAEAYELMMSGKARFRAVLTM